MTVPNTTHLHKLDATFGAYRATSAARASLLDVALKAEITLLDGYMKELTQTVVVHVMA